MGEERYEKRVLETWPCGCRVWRVEPLVGDTVKGDEVERQERCRTLMSLVGREERADRRVIAAYTDHGGRSPEYDWALVAWADLRGEIEEHYNNDVPTVEVLDTRPA